MKESWGAGERELERESWTKNGRRKGNIPSIRGGVASPGVVTGDHRTMSPHSLNPEGARAHTPGKLTMAKTDDTRVHQPLYLQQSGVWGINKSPVCREIYNHRLTTQGRARTAAAPQSAQALSSARTSAFRPPRSRAPLARISRTWRRPSSAPPPCSGPRSARRSAARSARRLREPSLQEPAGASEPAIRSAARSAG